MLRSLNIYHVLSMTEGGSVLSSLYIPFLVIVYFLVQALRIVLEGVRWENLNFIPKLKWKLLHISLISCMVLYIDLYMLTSTMPKLFFNNRCHILSKMDSTFFEIMS